MEILAAHPDLAICLCSDFILDVFDLYYTVGVTYNHDWRSATSVLTAGRSEESNLIDPKGERQLDDCLNKVCLYHLPTKLREDSFFELCVAVILSTVGARRLPTCKCAPLPAQKLPQTGPRPTPGHVQTCSTWISLYRHLLESFLVSIKVTFSVSDVYIAYVTKIHMQS